MSGSYDLSFGGKSDGNTNVEGSEEETFYEVRFVCEAGPEVYQGSLLRGLTAADVLQSACAHWSLSVSSASLWTGDKQLLNEEAVIWLGGPPVFDLRVVKKDVFAEAVLHVVKKDLFAEAVEFVRPENEHFLFGADLHNQIMTGATDVGIYMHKDNLNSIKEFKKSGFVCSNSDHNLPNPKRKNVFDAFFYVGGEPVQTKIYLTPRKRGMCDCESPKYKCVRVTEKDVEPARLSVSEVSLDDSTANAVDAGDAGNDDDDDDNEAAEAAVAVAADDLVFAFNAVDFDFKDPAERDDSEQKVFGLWSHQILMREEKEDGPGITVYVRADSAQNWRTTGRICSNLRHKQPNASLCDVVFFSYRKRSWCETSMHVVRSELKDPKECCSDTWYKYKKVEKVENKNWVKLQVNALDSYTERCVVLPLKQFYLSKKFQPPIFAMLEVQSLRDKSKVLNLSDLFDGMLQRPKKGPFVLAGDGKIGKSTLCRQLACQWANDEPTGYDAIVYVPLSHKDTLNVWKSVDRLKQIELQDWVTAYWKSSGYVFPRSLDEVFDALLKLKVLWLFDGFEDLKCPNIGSHGLLSHLKTLKIGSALITSCYSTAPICSFGWRVLGLSDLAQKEVLQKNYPSRLERSAMVTWMKERGLDFLFRSPELLRLLCVADALKKQQKEACIVEEPCLRFASDVLGWVLRCLLKGEDDVSNKWSRLIDLGYQTYGRQDARLIVSPDEIIWLERCGLIGEHQGWSFPIFATFFAACYVVREGRNSRAYYLFDRAEHKWLWRLVTRLVSVKADQSSSSDDRSWATGLWEEQSEESW